MPKPDGFDAADTKQKQFAIDTAAWQLELQLPQALLTGAITMLLTAGQGLGMLLKTTGGKLPEATRNVIEKLYLDNADQCSRAINTLKPSGIPGILEEPPHPELDKLQAAREKSQAIVEFLDFAKSREFNLFRLYHGKLTDDEIRKMIAEFFNADLAKAIEERKALATFLEAAREQQKTDTPDLVAKGVTLPPS